MDPFVALGAAAAVTTKLKLGTGICLIVERDPIITAKEIATLDMLSNGRFMFGIGGGWNSEEMENHGTNFRRRFRLLRERILAMKAIWTEEEAEFHGEFVDFDKIWSYPKPVQKPHPPIFMGGDGATTFDRVVEFCDGWMPIARGAGQEGVLVEKIALLRKQAEEAGRDPNSIPRVPVRLWQGRRGPGVPNGRGGSEPADFEPAVGRAGQDAAHPRPVRCPHIIDTGTHISEPGGPESSTVNGRHLWVGQTITKTG